MRITFITDNFPPEVNAPATRTYEHCKEWVDLGAEVTVITCHPNFPQGKIYDGYKNSLKTEEYIDGIRTIRLWSYVTANKGVVKRTADYLSFAMMAALQGLFVKSDIIIATSPQFFTTWAGYFLSLLKRQPWVFELRDLWPESIATVGAIKRGKLYEFLEKVEMLLYRKSSVIIPNTPAFKTNLVNRGINEDKIHVIPNGSNLKLFKKQEKDIKLLKELGITQPFVFGYIGTHGMAHSLDFVIKTIAEVPPNSCHFLFVGDGAEKEHIVSIAKEKRIKNVTFLDPIPKNDIPRYISITDAALVPLKKSDTFKTVIPSKIFESCAMGKPILLGVEGQAKELIDEFGAGLSYEPENTDDLLEKIEMFSAGKVNYDQLVENALKLSKAYDRKKLAKEMYELLAERIKV